MAKVSPGTVKNRLKSLQIEYYSSHRLSKMSIHSLNSVNEIKERENEICVVSQIYVDDELIAYYPYVLVGKYIKKMNLAKNFFPRIAEAISEQLTACYLQKFKGGDWLFGDKFAQMLIANCVSSNLHNGIKFAHLIEKIEQLSVSTFEGEYFSTGVIVSRILLNISKEENMRHIILRVFLSFFSWYIRRYFADGFQKLEIN